MPDTRQKLTIIWIFLVLNFLYCDVFTLFYGPMAEQIMAGNINGIPVSQAILLAFGVALEVPMVMILVSRLAPESTARKLNMIAAPVLVIGQIGTIFLLGPTLHYLFFSAVEIATLAWIFVIARRWQIAL